MAVETESDLKLEIAHVLTIDVVAYSTLLIHEQSRVMTELNKVVRNTPRFRAAEAEGKLIRLPTGDGMALVFHGDPEAPIECAMQISSELKGHADVALRMGIHSGPVSQVLDVNDRSNVAGAGLDMAQRVMDCGDGGHILLSKRVADDLAPYARWNRHLHDLGECEVKHGRKISLFNFYTEALGNPESPQKVRAAFTAKTRRRRFILLGGGAVALLALAIAVWLFWQASGRTQVHRSLAVLPFLDLSEAKDQEYFSDGITEQIINSLGKIRGLLVVARSSSFAFKNKPEDVRAVGKKLGVTYVVEGSVNRSPGRVRVYAHLIDVNNGYQLWAESYDSNEQDALSLQSDVAQKVAGALEIQLQLKEATRLSRLPTQDTEAYDLYLRGRYLLNKRTVETIEQARVLFARAVAKDPIFALGYAGIADSFILLGEYGALSAGEAAEKAWPQVEAAIRTDEQLAEGYISRAMLLTHFEWNWTAAEADFLKALELKPSSVPARHWYAFHLAEIGRFDDALRQIRRAQKQDPLSPIVRAAAAKIFFVAHRYEEAIEESRGALELEPNFIPAYAMLARTYAKQQDHDAALQAATKHVEIARGGWAHFELAYVHAAAGRKEESDAAVREGAAQTGAYPAVGMAAICLAQRDPDGALRWLDTAIVSRSIEVVWIRVDPRLDDLRSDARFIEAVARLSPRRRVGLNE